MSIADNLARIQERIARAAARASRRADKITLVAVAKTFPAERIREAYEAGVRHFGENRVQEWEEKRPQLADLSDAIWHLVGHLQSNKARRAVSLFHTIDSVDSLPLAQKLDRAVAENNRTFTAETQGSQRDTQSRRLPILIEVRLAPEETKHGVEPAELPALVESILALPHLDLRGLMCIPPFFENPEDARAYFQKLRELRDSLRQHLRPRVGALLAAPSPAGASDESLLPDLSMGMSHDFEVAIAEGATQIRLGTALFGLRGGTR